MNKSPTIIGYTIAKTDDIYRTIQPSQWLPQHQHINSKRKTFKLIHKHRELEMYALRQ